MYARTMTSILAGCVALGSAGAACGQGFDFGSNGSAGVINVPSGTTNYPLPPDGVIHAVSVNVANGGVLTFIRNASNTPVFLLSQGDVVVTQGGSINLIGGTGTASSGGLGAPGGFDGGQPGFTGTPAGDGKGPGGSKAGTQNAGDGPGNAGHRTAGAGPRDGAIYGSSLQIPLLGGSGGGGRNDVGGALNSQLGGAAGGGAILLASNTRVFIDGTINAHGGVAGAGEGSGGAIRLLAPKVDIATANIICVQPTSSCTTTEVPGGGYIRIDTIDRTDVALSSQLRPAAAASVGSYMTVNGPITGKLRVAAIAGTPYIADSGSITVVLPNGSPPLQPVTIEAQDFGVVINLKVAVTPDSGPSATYDLAIDNTSGGATQGTVQVNIPPNVRCVIHAWRV